jgi:hypothetical protein
VSRVEEPELAFLTCICGTKQQSQFFFKFSYLNKKTHWA